MEFGNMAIGENAPGRRLGTWPTSKKASLHALKHRGRFGGGSNSSSLFADFPRFPVFGKKIIKNQPLLGMP